MNIGIAGLGLIGGSLAKAYKASGNTVFGYDADSSVNEIALLSEAMDGILDQKTIPECDCIFIALNPKPAVSYFESIAPFVNGKTIVVDCCGTKREVCEKCFAAAKKYGFTFVGGHPMAGFHKSGFKYSRANLFNNASMIITPENHGDIDLFGRLENILKSAGFGKITVTTPQKHDEMIAFTSQMAHIVSNAYIKSPTAKKHKGFSAGSYKDLTRVAWLNSDMWTELFMQNKDNLIRELEFFIKSVNEYKTALENDDSVGLRVLLEDGKNKKEEVDGR